MAQATKPRARPADGNVVRILPRPRLIRLIADATARTVLLIAPAGYGKTTLARQWLEAHPGVARRIVIPAAAKQEIRDKLDQAGFTERLIYPGADGLARWLARYYQHR